jgi:hypothetical protein
MGQLHMTSQVIVIFSADQPLPRIQGDAPFLPRRE